MIFLKITVFVCLAIVMLILMAIAIISWIRRILGVESITPEKIATKWSWDKGVPEQAKGIMWRLEGPGGDVNRSTQVEGEE